MDRKASSEKVTTTPYDRLTWLKASLTDWIQDLEKEYGGTEKLDVDQDLVKTLSKVAYMRRNVREQLLTYYLLSILEILEPNCQQNVKLDDKIKQIEKLLKERKKGLDWIDNLLRYTPETEKVDVPK